MQRLGIRTSFSFLIFLLIFSLIAACFSFFALREDPSAALSDESTEETDPITVILDAGHGGEDGGASSASGILEKDLNLSITFLLKDFLEANGIRVVMTRTDDRLLYDTSVDYNGRKKALDLAARKKIGEETPNSIFVSIHMNAYPQTQYSGLQVWYSPNHEDSKAIADNIQNTVQELLQPENNRRIKPATSSIYLLHRLKSPAVLVECGFLSNEAEAARLSSPEYQKELAFCLFLAISQHLNPQNRGFSQKYREKRLHSTQWYGKMREESNTRRRPI